MTDNFFTDADLISVYTRAQALEDGALVDVSELAREAGFTFPTAITAALHARLTPSEQDKKYGQDYTGRLWDVLWMAKLAARRTENDRVRVQVIIAEVKRGKLLHPVVELWAVCSPGDIAEPVITIGFLEDF